MKATSSLFGPVPSRRFGRSLGVDLTPFKTCSFDCVFCQLGRTVKKTVDRREYLPIEPVLVELSDWFDAGGSSDFVTLSGSGEPTLHSRFGEVIDFVRERSPIPTALLTNGTTLSLEAVRQAACRASVVKVSLSCWDQKSFQWLNRPHDSLRFENLVEGIRRFRGGFAGELWIEVFLVSGMNAMPDAVSRIAAVVETIGPNRVHLNTAVRPPAEDFVGTVAQRRLEELRGLFHPAAEIIAEIETHRDPKTRIDQDSLLAMLVRRPCTMEQIVEGFGMHFNEASKHLGHLIRSGRIREVRTNGAVYYAAAREEGGGSSGGGDS